MHVPPRVLGGLVARWSALLGGLFLFAVAIVCQLEAELGLSPWDVLHQGIADHTPLTLRRGEHRASASSSSRSPGGSAPGSASAPSRTPSSSAVFIQGLTAIPAVDSLSEDALGVRIALLAVSMPIFGIASALYIGA